MNREVLKSTENGHHGKWVGGGWGGNLNMDTSQLLLFQKLGCGVTYSALHFKNKNTI